MSRVIDHEKGQYPHSLVWCPLPVLSWILPCVGHVGITDKDGVIYDFAGPYTINKNNFAFGEPTRYYQLDLAKCKDQDWNMSVQRGCDLYAKRNHNLLCDNCHSMVAQCLNNMAYGETRAHSGFSIGLMVFFKGRFCSTWAMVKTYGPFVVWFILVVVLSTVL